jgi:hypothetical protein
VHPSKMKGGEGRGLGGSYGNKLTNKPTNKSPNYKNIEKTTFERKTKTEIQINGKNNNQQQSNT